jgi:hypothetical protein
VMFGLMGGIPLLYLVWPSNLRAMLWPPDRDDVEARDRAVPSSGMLSRSFRRSGLAPERAASAS